MRVCDLGTNRKSELLSQSGLWQRPVESVSPLELSMYLRQHLGTPNYTRAVNEAKEVVSAAWDALLAGEIENAPRILYFEVPTSRLTVDELSSWLEEVSVVRRRAILFALEARCSPKEVIRLKHSDLRTMRLPELAIDIVRAMPRHISLEHVFWEPMADTGAAMPLVGLEASIHDVSQGLGFDALARLYDDMLLIDQDDDAIQFWQQIRA